MKIKVNHKNDKHSEAIDQRISSKSQRFERHFGKEIDVKWTYSSKEFEHHAEVSVIGDHFEHHAKATSENLWKAFDMVSEKMERQLVKHKQKSRDKTGYVSEYKKAS